MKSKEEILKEESLEQIKKYIEIQKGQLLEWRTVLTAVAYMELVKWATSTNDTVTNANEIRRGGDLSTFIHNYAIGHRDM